MWHLAINEGDTVATNKATKLAANTWERVDHVKETPQIEPKGDVPNRWIWNPEV